MQFYPSDASIANWEQQVRTGARTETVEELLCLAWGLRQRDTRRALLLAEDVQGLLSSTGWSPERQSLARARLDLLRSEASLLAGALDDAKHSLQQALPVFQAQADAIGQADCHWQAHYLAADRGDAATLRSELRQALSFSERAGDSARALLFMANLARAEVFVDQVQAERDWGGRLPVDTSQLAAMEGAAVEDYRGLIAGMNGDYLLAIKSLATAFDLAMRSGQLRRAITLATNLGYTHTKMSDFQTAMEWLKRGLDLARGTRWPSMISLCLAHTGEALRRLEQRSDARELLLECLRLNSRYPDSRTHALALSYLGSTELDSGQGEAALVAFGRLGQAASIAQSLDLQVDAQLGLARAELMCGRFTTARAHAQEGLRLAREQHEPGNEVDLLWVLGDIQQAQDQALQGQEAAPAPGAASGAAGLALGWYQAALQRAQTIPAYTPPVRLLEATAKAFAEVGDFEQAYQWSQRASEARQRSFNEDAARRSSALRAHHQIESARAESEHLRRLAESEAARFQLLRDSHEVLQHLGQIGQEITNELVAERIFAVMERHIHALLDAPCMAVYLLDDGGQQLYCAFGMENAEPFTDPPIAMSSTRSLCVRCVRERKEYLLGEAPPSDLGEQVPGTSSQQSLLFAPLGVGERVIGVMTIQSPRAKAYGERQQLIFRTLCSYIAIALDNAGAYLRLSEMQRQMMAQEKLAALGSMVAGVAHELNTPIGNSLLIATTLLSATQDFVQRVDGQALRRSDWQDYASRTLDGLGLINRSMETAAALVRSFKEVAADRSAEQRGSFGLRRLCEHSVQSMGERLRKAGIQVEIDVPEGLRLEGYAGPLEQVVVILLNNALMHAFEGRSQGRLSLKVEAVGTERVRLEVEDDGRGMPRQVQERIFDPFFTTKFGQGGIGLGLSIAHNIVSTLLGGQLSVKSAEGEGSCFVLDLPMKAP
jgi:signal transduction histidine kinase/tetratricopeptide (TPR) repeat protein